MLLYQIADFIIMDCRQITTILTNYLMLRSYRLLSYFFHQFFLSQITKLTIVANYFNFTSFPPHNSLFINFSFRLLFIIQCFKLIIVPPFLKFPNNCLANNN